jgi:hypothetical protein
MRKKLKDLLEKRTRFSAKFERFGTKNGYMAIEKTILLKEVKCIETDEIVTDHLWFTCYKGWDSLGLEKDDCVEFDARVVEYIKGYKGYNIERQIDSPLSIDYKLERPTKLKKIKKESNDI